MVDGLLAINPLRKHHEFDLRSPSQRSRFRKRMEQEAMNMVGEYLYELDAACRERLGKRCKKLSESSEFIYAAMMLQDRVRPMDVVRYLRKNDPHAFAYYMISDDALRMQVERMREYLRLKQRVEF